MQMQLKLLQSNEAFEFTTLQICMRVTGQNYTDKNQNKRRQNGAKQLV